jgi:hypothetical protein
MFKFDDYRFDHREVLDGEGADHWWPWRRCRAAGRGGKSIVSGV